MPGRYVPPVGVGSVTTARIRPNGDHWFLAELIRVHDNARARRRHPDAHALSMLFRFSIDRVQCVNPLTERRRLLRRYGESPSAIS